MMKNLTIVIKLGTSSIVDEKTHEPLLSILSVIVETAVKLQHDGHKVVLVSSGAIGVGLRRMDIEKRPKQLREMQALAAIGQCRLMSLWDQLFSHLRQPVAQILLTRSDLADQTQYHNAQSTFSQLLDMGVIPIVNENDTLAVTEIKFGDNDTLSAITAGMVHADYLFLMTDVDCLYDKNPRTNPEAKPIEIVEDIADIKADVSSQGSLLGTGGMFTKIVAAERATTAGVTTIITKSSRPGNIRSIVDYIESQKDLNAKTWNSRDSPNANSPNANSQNANTPLSIASDSIASRLNLSDSITLDGQSSPASKDSPSLEPMVAPPRHTRFLPAQNPIRDHYFWLLHGIAPRGNLYIDEGAFVALVEKHGLFPVGVVDVDGMFAQQQAVRIFVVKRLPQTKSIATPGSPGSSQTQSHERLSPAPREVGRALVNYSATEIKRIMGLQSAQISKVLGYADSDYVALRENIAFFRPERSRPVTPSLEVAQESLAF